MIERVYFEKDKNPVVTFKNEGSWGNYVLQDEVRELAQALYEKMKESMRKQLEMLKKELDEL